MMPKNTKNLVVSPKHKVYTNNQNFPSNALPISSDVVNTGTSDCCFRCGSFDQIGDLIDSANAKYGASSLSGSESFACLRNDLYDELLKNLMMPSISVCLISNSCSESLDLERHSDLYFLNSDFINSGAQNLRLSKEKIYELTDLGFINEKKILLSNISFIFYFDNSSLCLEGSSESKRLKRPFLEDSPNSTDHLINSFSSLDSSLSFSVSSVESFTNCFTILERADSNSFLNSAGISTLMIISSINHENDEEYLNVSEGGKMLNRIRDLSNLLTVRKRDSSEFFHLLMKFRGYWNIKNFRRMKKDKIYKLNGFVINEMFPSDLRVTRRFYFSVDFEKDKLFKSFNLDNFTLSPRCYPLWRICRVSNSLVLGGVL